MGSKSSSMSIYIKCILNVHIISYNITAQHIYGEFILFYHAHILLPSNTFMMLLLSYHAHIISPRNTFMMCYYYLTMFTDELQSTAVLSLPSDDLAPHPVLWVGKLLLLTEVRAVELAVLHARAALFTVVVERVAHLVLHSVVAAVLYSCRRKIHTESEYNKICDSCFIVVK